MQAALQTNVHRKTVAASHSVSRSTPKGVALAAVRPAVQPCGCTIQTKLAVNTPGDKFEHEANAVADKVIQFHPKEAIHTPVHAKGEMAMRSQPAKVYNLVARKCTNCEAEEKKLQRKNNESDKGNESISASGTMQRVEADLKASKGQGRPLPVTVNKFMSKAMGTDFSKVRIHTGPKAIGMSKGLNAYAFTHGADIYFNEGQFDPESDRGRHLLAHELAHVIQQGHASPVDGRKQSTSLQSESVQRFELSDLNPFDVSIEDLVRRYVPELFEIQQAGGLLEWVEQKVTGAIEKIMNAALGPVRNAVNVISNLSPTMAKIIIWIKNAGVKISKNDCSSFTELGHMVEQLVEELAGPAIEKIKEIAGKVSDWCKDIWEKFGLPVWDFIKKFVGAQWEMLKKLGNWIWEKTQPIRDWLESVWIRFKNWLGIGEGPEGQNGILQWIEGKITAAWNKIQEKIAPYKKQLMVVVGVLVMLSPAGPLIAAVALFGVIFKAINWIRKNIHSPQDIVKLRVKFEKEILPSITQGVTKASEGLKAVFAALTGKFGKVAEAFGNLTNLVASGILSFIQSALQWVTDKFIALVEWATDKLGELVAWLDSIFQKVIAFVAPIIRFLEKVSAVAENIMELPTLIIGGLWKKVPSCIRIPVEDFLVNVILKKVPFFGDIVAIAGVWQKIKKGAMDILKTVFIHGDLKGGILKAFKLFLDILNIPVQLVTGIFNKAVDAFDTIVSKPRVIFSSIVSAIKAGFQQFYKNFLKNTLDAVGNWIFSKVKGVKMPKEYTIQSVFGLALDILGIREDNIFDRIEKKTSKDFAKRLRATYESLKGAAVWVIEILKDPKAAFERAKQYFKDLKNKLFERIGAWIAENVIGKFMTEMAAMLASTPFGEAIEAIIYAYNMVKTAIEYAEKILRVVDSVLDSVLDLASGMITKAADTVEKGLVFGLEVAVAFIAKVISIGDLPQEVKKIVEEHIRPIVNKGIDAVIDGVIAIVKTVKEFAGDVKDAIADTFNWGKTKKSFTAKNGEPHNIYVEKRGGKLVLMVATIPEPATDLTRQLRTRFAGDPAKLSVIARLEPIIETVEKGALIISGMEQSMKNAPADQKAGIQKEINKSLESLIILETTATMLLSGILTGEDYTEIENIYEVEGRVGVHQQAPKSQKAQFAADHQPSNIVLQEAAKQKDAPELLKQVVRGRSSLGFTITVGNFRHYAGRTYGREARPIADLLVIVLKELLAEEKNKRRQGILLEQVLKDSAIRDAEAMEEVVSAKDLSLPQWRDLNSNEDLSDAEKKKLRDKIETQVKKGERIIKGSPITINTADLG